MSDVLDAYRELETRVLGALRPDLREEEFGALALDVFAFQRRWNRPYGNFCSTKPEPQNWREIPAVPQSAFKRYRLSIAPPEAVTKTFRTSGTTGEGFGEHHFVNTRLYEAAIIAGWSRLMLPRLYFYILVASPIGSAPHSSLSHMMLTLAGFSAGLHFMVNSDGRFYSTKLLRNLRQHAAAQQPVAVLGTALAFVNYFADVGSESVALPAGSFAMETGGYKGREREIPKADLYSMFSVHLGLSADDVINEYGMTELSSQFYTRGLGRPHEGGPWVRALVIDPETGNEVGLGETGVLRIFDLANLGSVLAIETQDLAVRREQGFELLGRDPGALPRGCSRAADERMRT